MKNTAVCLFLAMILVTGITSSCKIKHTREAVPTQGELCFEVSPGSAVVEVDGVAAGKAREFTPSRGCLALDTGTHSLRVYKEDHVPYEREIYVGTSTQNLRIKLPEKEK